MTATIIAFADIQRAHARNTRHLSPAERADEMSELYQRLESAYARGCQQDVARHMREEVA